MFTKVNLKYAGVNVLLKKLFHPSRVHCGWRGKLSLQLSGEQIVNITPGICSVCGHPVARDLEQTNKMGCDDACDV